MEWSFDVATALGMFGGLGMLLRYWKEQRVAKKQQIQRVVISWVYVENDKDGGKGKYALRVSNYSDTAVLDLHITSRVKTNNGAIDERSYYYPVITPGDFLLEYGDICAVRLIDPAVEHVNVLQKSSKHGFKATCQDIDRVTWETSLPMQGEYFMRPWKEVG